MDAFFLVVRENADNESFSTNSKVKHATFEEAKKEAERLCEKESKRFFIFESVGYTEQAKPPVVYVPIKYHIKSI